MSLQPGVKDTQTEMLIEEKVDLFWKAVENGANKNKRGQVSSQSSCQLTQIQYIVSIDHGHIFGEEGKEVLVLFG